MANRGAQNVALPSPSIWLSWTSGIKKTLLTTNIQMFGEKEAFYAQ